MLLALLAASGGLPSARVGDWVETESPSLELRSGAGLVVVENQKSLTKKPREMISSDLIGDLETINKNQIVIKQPKILEYGRVVYKQQEKFTNDYSN